MNEKQQTAFENASGFTASSLDVFLAALLLFVVAVFVLVALLDAFKRLGDSENAGDFSKILIRAFVLLSFFLGFVLLGRN